MRWAVLLMGLTLACLPGRSATLKVGDPAPKLGNGKWVQGDPVKAFEKDKAYIVEFWATWCGPCRESIPHLNEVYGKYKDKGLVVIGQDCWENDEDEVPRFIKKMGDKMTYRVALDDKTSEQKGWMAINWMEAAGQNGIPSAFVVGKDGKIAWIGHPMTLKEKTLDEVLAGTYDVAKAAAEYQKKKEQEEKMSAVWGDFNKAARAKEWDQAEGLLDKMQAMMDEDERGNLDMIRLRLKLSKSDADSAEKLATKLAQKEPENAMYHNELAWMIVTTGKASKSLLDFAEKEANRAADLSKGKDGSILDTVARVQFLKGDKEGAIKTQQKAVELITDERAKKSFEKTLDSYKAGNLPE